jgi:hypothetical protein
LLAAIREFQAREERRVDPKEFRVAIDVLEGEFSANARECKNAGEHLVAGSITAASWIARTCGMSVSSAADRVRVGTQLELLPRVAALKLAAQFSFTTAARDVPCAGRRADLPGAWRGARSRA